MSDFESVRQALDGESEPRFARNDRLPKVSVVISCRNGARTLPAMLESIVRQRYPGWWEVVLVDNGSTDSTSSVMAEYSGRFPICTILQNTSGDYQASGVNCGVKHSAGDAVLLLDSDDVLADDYILHMGSALAKAPFVGARIDCRRLNDDGVRHSSVLDVEHAVGPMYRYLPVVIGAAMGVQRNVFEKIGGLDEDQPSQPDVDISWRLHRAGFQATYVRDAVLHYRFKESARAVMRQEMVYGIGEALLYRNHRRFGMPGRDPIRAIVGWLRTLVALAAVWRPGGVERLAGSLGKNLGRLRGSLRYRIWYL